MLTAQVCILAAHGVTGCDAYLGFFVVAAVDVHPHDVLVGGFVVDYLGSLDHAIGAGVARCCLGQQGAFVVPFDKVGRGVAVDVDE